MQQKQRKSLKERNPLKVPMAILLKRTKIQNLLLWDKREILLSSYTEASWLSSIKSQQMRD